ncbi:MAG TPA: SAM-dependent methyltransferase [Myxococcaceae bacterium]|nr:SAM-dependent methyltransferase [Myxococcaceae bacterium]
MTKHMLSVLALCTVACATQKAAEQPKTVSPSEFQALVADPARTDADRTLDPQRKPAEMLAFFQVAPGQKVAELGAGSGYTTELLARAVGPTGVVYSQNPDAFSRFAGKALTERLARPGLQHVVTVERELDNPLPPAARDLDLVVSHAIYHDTVWLQADRDRMNAAVFAALKPGGAYVVIDSSAKSGTGSADAATLHRIDEDFVIAEVQKAGFTLQTRGDFLRNPADDRTWDASPRAAAERRGTSDRFALRFVKPQQ